MNFLRIIFICGLLVSSSVTLAQSNTESQCTPLNQIREAFQSMLSGRVLVNEEGTKLSFGRLGVFSKDRFFVETKMDFANGTTISAIEVIRHDGDRVLLEQVVDGVTTRRFEVSIEQPYNVLRTKPLNSTNSQFIARECLLKQKVGTICYVKVRYGSEVIVSVFSENSVAN